MATAQQGHRYLFFGRPVIALASGDGDVPVLFFDPKELWGSVIQVKVSARHLVPQPMKYFHGQTPQ